MVYGDQKGEKNQKSDNFSHSYDKDYNPYGKKMYQRLTKPSKQLMNPKNLDELTKSIKLMNQPRYFKNPSTALEPATKRLDKLRVKYNLGEKKEVEDNPYSRQALIRHRARVAKGDGTLDFERYIEEDQHQKMAGLGGGGGNNKSIREQRREFTQNFESKVNQKFRILQEQDRVVGDVYGGTRGVSDGVQTAGSQEMRPGSDSDGNKGFNDNSKIEVDNRVRVAVNGRKDRNQVVNDPPGMYKMVKTSRKVTNGEMRFQPHIRVDGSQGGRRQVPRIHSNGDIITWNAGLAQKNSKNLVKKIQGKLLRNKNIRGSVRAEYAGDFKKRSEGLNLFSRDQSFNKTLMWAKGIKSKNGSKKLVGQRVRRGKDGRLLDSAVKEPSIPALEGGYLQKRNLLRREEEQRRALSRQIDHKEPFPQRFRHRIIRPKSEMSNIIFYDFPNYKKIVDDHYKRKQFVPGLENNRHQSVDIKKLKKSSGVLHGERRVESGRGAGLMFEDYEKERKRTLEIEKMLYHPRNLDRKMRGVFGRGRRNGSSMAGIGSERFSRPALRYFQGEKKDSSRSLQPEDVTNKGGGRAASQPPELGGRAAELQ